MLLKLLKYDLRSVFKYWWIAALSTLGLSVLGGFCILILDSSIIANVYQILAGFAMGVVILGFVAFLILSQILVFMRYYKNFFSDEGYLTFTLPVKRTHLITSKLITATLNTVCTAIVLVIDVVVMLAIGYYTEFFSLELWLGIYGDILDFISIVGGYFYVYIVELIVGFVALTAFSALFMFVCITIASVIAKKSKIFTAIGIYYVANGAISLVTQMIFVYTEFGLSEWIGNIPEATMPAVVAIVLLLAISIVAILSSALYTLNLYLCDRKLNLN